MNDAHHRYARRAYVVPWYSAPSLSVPEDVPLALKIYDLDIITVLREINHAIFKSILQAERDLPQLEQLCLHTLHLEVLHHSLSGARTTMMARNDRQLGEYRKQAIYDIERSAGPLWYALRRADETQIFRFDTYDGPDGEPRVPPIHIHPKTMPFALPKTMARQNMRETHLGRKFYWWTPKSNGLHMMWQNVSVGQRPLSSWIDRNGACWAIPDTRIPEDFFRGTVWDGELVLLDDGTVAFLIFDHLVGGGQITAHLPQLTRLTLARVGIEEWERRVPSTFPRITRRVPRMNKKLYLAEHWLNDRFVVRVKRIYPSWDMPYLIREMTYADHEMDGLIGMTDEDPLYQGGSQTMFKFKMDHTLDFQVRIIQEWPDAMRPYTMEGGLWASLWTYDSERRVWLEWDRHGQTFIPYSRAEELGIPSIKELNGAILECRRIPRPSGLPFSPNRMDAASRPAFMWNPFLIRDKFRPNNLKTVLLGEEACDCPVKLSELIPNSYLLAVTMLHRSDTLSMNLYRQSLSSLPPTFDHAGVEPLPADATGLAADHKSTGDGKEGRPPLPICDGWRILAHRDSLLQACRTTQDFIRLWRTPIPGSQQIRLPEPTVFGVTSLPELLKQHQLLCTNHTSKHKEYHLTRV